MSSSSAGARRRDTTLPPHVDEALVAYSALTGRSLSAAMALAVERGIVYAFDFCEHGLYLGRSPALVRKLCKCIFAVNE